MDLNIYAPREQCELLLVEDNPGDIMLVEEALNESGLKYHLNTIRNGGDVIDYLKSPDCVKPDIILLDLNLPRKNGKDVLREIKGDDKLESIPILVLTTSEAESDIYSCYKLRANCYITKPVDFDRFMEVIKTVKEFWTSMVKLPPRNYN
ncbi:MAG: response regulator [Methanococcaceae archaeon]